MATTYSAAAIYQEMLALYGPKVMSKKGTTRFVHFKFNVNTQQKITLDYYMQKLCEPFKIIST